MSDTPMTDEREYQEGHQWFKVVTSDFARQLERELAAAKAEIAVLWRINTLLEETIETLVAKERGHERHTRIATTRTDID